MLDCGCLISCKHFYITIPANARLWVSDFQLIFIYVTANLWNQPFHEMAETF